MNHKKIVERIIETSQDKLNTWELDFISDMHQQEYPFTDGQKEKILQINRKVLS